MLKRLFTICLVVGMTATVGSATVGTWLDWQVEGTAGSTATGSVQDSGLANRDGSYNGDAVFSSDTKIGSGTSLHVDGAGDYVYRGGYVDGFGITDWSAESRVYELDFKLTDEVTTGTQYIFDEYNHDGHYGGVWMRAARVNSTTYNLATGLRGGSGANTWQSSGNIRINVGQWYHAKVILLDLSGTVGADDAEFYLDGVKKPTEGSYAGISATGNSSGYRVTLGAAGSSGGSAMGGYVDNFVISTVPEPATIGLLILGFGFLRRSRRVVK